MLYLFFYHFKKFVEFFIASKHMPTFIVRPNYNFIDLKKSWFIFKRIYYTPLN